MSAKSEPVNVYVSVPAVLDQRRWVDYFRGIESPRGVEYRFAFRHSLIGDWMKIRRTMSACDVVIADFSATPDSGIYPDPDVLSEAAFARLGPRPVPVILLHRQSSLALPFDWRQLMRIGGVHPVHVPDDVAGVIPQLGGWLSELATRPAPPAPSARRLPSSSLDVFVSQPMQRGDGSPGPSGFDFALFYAAVRRAAEMVTGPPKVRLAILKRDEDHVRVWHRVMSGISRCSLLIADFSPDAKSFGVSNPDVLTEATLAAHRYNVPIVGAVQDGTELPANWSHLEPIRYSRDTVAGLAEQLAARIEQLWPSIRRAQEDGIDPDTGVGASESVRDMQERGEAEAKGNGKTTRKRNITSRVSILPPKQRGEAADILAMGRPTDSAPISLPSPGLGKPDGATATTIVGTHPVDQEADTVVHTSLRKDEPYASTTSQSLSGMPGLYGRNGQPGSAAATRAAGPFLAFRQALREGDNAAALDRYREAIEADPWQHALFNPERFIVNEVIGGGPFGVVFRATIPPTEDDPHEMPVVIKAILHPERLGQDPDQVVSNLDLLRHAPPEGMLQVLEWDRYPRGEANAYWHFWTPWIEDAEPLDKHLARVGALSEAETTSIGAGIVRGLLSAHLFRVPHLGLRPSNVLIRKREPKDATRAVSSSTTALPVIDESAGGYDVWLRDFGFFPSFPPAANDVPEWMAPIIAYAAPEQRGEMATTPGLVSDIYSFGLTLLSCLFLSPKIGLDTLDRLENLEQANLKNVIEGCLRYDPRARFVQLEPVLEMLAPAGATVDLRPSSVSIPVLVDQAEAGISTKLFRNGGFDPAIPGLAPGTNASGRLSLMMDDPWEDAIPASNPGTGPDEPRPQWVLLRGATREEGPLRPADELMNVEEAPDVLIDEQPLPPRTLPIPAVTGDRPRELIVGVDLGTCNSLLAYVDENGETKVVQHSQESIVTPSAVYFPDSFQSEVGLDAKRMSVFEPLNCAQFFKLNMGDQRRSRPFHGTKYGPEMLSALVLRRLVEDAVDQLGGPDEVAIRDVVVTVPSSWNDVRREATRLAVRLAGLNPIGIVSEPVAVALETALRHLRDGKTVFVYDFGGGTFDVTVFRLEEKTVRLLANMGLPVLGGNNLDQRLYDHVRQRFRDEFEEFDPPDPDHRPQTRWELLSRCEQVKVDLCRKAPPQTITVAAGGHTGQYKVSLEDFERLIRTDVETTRNFVLGALLEAGLRAEDVDFVLSVGGSSQVPSVQRMLGEIFGTEKLVGKRVSPQETVARGACRNAADIWCEAARRGDIDAALLPPGLMERLGDAPVLREETPQAVSVVAIDAEDDDEMVEVVVPQGAPWPAVGVLYAKTADDHQTNVICRVRSGSSADVKATDRLGTVSFPLIPGIPKGCALKLEVWYDGPERMFLALWDGASGQVQQRRVPWPGPNQRQITASEDVVRDTEVILD